jgi:hypothetical protein
VSAITLALVPAAGPDLGPAARDLPHRATAPAPTQPVVAPAPTQPVVAPAPTQPGPDSLDALAAVLSVSCALQLRAIAHRGGPTPDAHVEELRRLLVRREGRRAGLARRRQIRHAVEAAASGRPGAITAGDRQALVRDLRELERALGPAARVGAGRSTSGDAGVLPLRPGS